MQGKACREAANSVVRKVTELMNKKRGQITDDTSCMVIDCKPHSVTTFKGYIPDQSLHRAAGSATFRHSSPDPSLHSHTNINAAGVSVHGSFRIPGGVWAHQAGPPPSDEFDAADPHSEVEPLEKSSPPAPAWGCFACCFSKPPVKDDSGTGEVEAAFSSLHSLGGAP